MRVIIPSTEKKVAGIMGINRAASPVLFGDDMSSALWKWS